MKNRTPILVSALGFVIALITLSYCSPDGELKPSSKVYKEEIKIGAQHVADFQGKYAEFINGLTDGQKVLVSGYVSESQTRAAAAKTNVEAKCECAPGQSTCSASSWFSSCCICWNPATQTGACGEYWGVATCRVENNPPPSLTAAKAGFAQTYVKFYPNRFAEMLKLASDNGVNTKSIALDLDKLVSLAEAE